MASRHAGNALAPLFNLSPTDHPSSSVGPFSHWLAQTSPELTWDHPHLKFIRSQLADVTLGHCRKLAISWPPQHFKTWSTTVRYPLWRMLREPGLRVGIGTYNQRYANKVSRWTRRIVERLGVPFGDSSSVDSWSLANGSTYIARGVGVGLSGEPIDLWVCLPGETLIHTQLGLMRIDDIVQMKDKPALLTYNHVSGGLEYKRVTGSSVTYSDQLVEFTDEHGRTLRCTDNHRVYTHERGYAPAGRIGSGETFLTVAAEASETNEGVPNPWLCGQDGPVQQAVPPFRVSASAVRGVRTVRTISQPVYDLRVEGNSNFFANGILVHNCDDPFKNREQADSPTHQEKVWEWHMDDVTPRIQQGGSYILIHTRWGPGDLIGRIMTSDDSPNWRYVRLPAIAETQEERDNVHRRQGLPIGVPDPLGREPGEPLCAAAFSAESLADKRRVLGVGFEPLYQQNDITRGGTFFERVWFGEPVQSVPAGVPLKAPRRIRYWDLASSRADSACYTSGVLMAKVGDTYYVEDVVRGRWNPAERNDIILQTAIADRTRPGFERTWFESPVFDKGGAAKRALIAKLAGHNVRGDDVGGTGSKEIRAEPLADAAKGGLVRLVAGPWNAAYLTELEGFPKSGFKDQVDSSSGAFNCLTRPGVSVVFGR